MSGKGLDSAKLHRRALVASAKHWKGVQEKRMTEAGLRYSLVGAELIEGPGKGAFIVFENPREVAWKFSLERDAARMAVCESGQVLMMHPEKGPYWSPMGCKVKACPVCSRRNASKQIAKWEPRVEAAASDGAFLYHLTLTQRCDAVPGGLVTELEQSRYGWRGDCATRMSTNAWRTSPGRAVGGESLGSAYARLRGNLRKWRQNRRSRASVAGLLGGYLTGIEWTGRAHGGIPRWHAHAHIFAVCESEQDARGALKAWCKLTGGSMRAQDVRVVDPSKVREVLKYPFKPANLTSAQRISVLAHMRGLKPQTPGGRWYGRARKAPYSGWYEASGPKKDVRRLQWFDEDIEEWRVYCTGNIPADRRGRRLTRFGVSNGVRDELSTWAAPWNQYGAPPEARA